MKVQHMQTKLYKKKTKCLLVQTLYPIGIPVIYFCSDPVKDYIPGKR